MADFVGFGFAVAFALACFEGVGESGERASPRRVQERRSATFRRSFSSVAMCEAPTNIRASNRVKLPVGRLSFELEGAIGADAAELVEPVELSFKPFLDRSIFQFLPPDIYTVHTF